MDYRLRDREEEKIKNRILWDKKEEIIHSGYHYTELKDCQLQRDALKAIFQFREQHGEPIYRWDKDQLKMYERCIERLGEEFLENKNLEASLLKETDPTKAAKMFAELKTKGRYEFETDGPYFSERGRRPTKKVNREYYDLSNSKLQDLYEKLGEEFLQKTLQNLEKSPKIKERLMEDLEPSKESGKTKIRWRMIGPL